MPELRVDEIGYWTEIKLKIIRDYSRAYAAVLGGQKAIRHYAYIDGFAGAGEHKSRATGEMIEGSPAIALKADFSHYHFVDMDGSRAVQLREIGKGQSNVSVYEGDCNSVLLDEVFPQCRYNDFRRALCLLDPYDLNPTWTVVYTAGQMKSIEIFLNFMIMDANMNVLWKNPDKVPATQIERMNAFWGDDSWREAGYVKQPGLFGDIEEKASNEAVAEAYGKRLQEIAGFKYVPKPLPMRNSRGSVIYYLFFASNNKTGDRIAKDVLRKYRNR